VVAIVALVTVLPTVGAVTPRLTPAPRVSPKPPAAGVVVDDVATTALFGVLVVADDKLNVGKLRLTPRPTLTPRPSVDSVDVVDGPVTVDEPPPRPRLSPREIPSRSAVVLVGV